MGYTVLIKLNPYIKRKIKGKKRIGAGGTRIVYDLGNGNVLKIAKSKKGIVCNKMEVTLYKSSWKRLKRYFARIVDYDSDYLWVTMKKYDRKFPNSPIYRRELMKVVKKFVASGIVPSKGVGNYHHPYAPNLRLKRNKQIVVIDYGGFKFGHSKKRSVAAEARIKGKIIIGSGARRIVYDLGNGYVLKVAKTKYGIKSNKREVRTFKSSPPSIKKLLGKITSYEKKYKWLKMKKYTQKFPHLKGYRRKLYRLRNVLRNYGINPYEILSNRGLPNYRNLRLKQNGRIIVIDYGNFRFRRISRRKTSQL